MFNLSTQEVGLSIEKSPVNWKNKTYYQEYTSFFGNSMLVKIKNDLKNLKMVKLEGQENKARERADYNELLCKELRIFFSNENITSILEKKFNTKLKFDSLDVWHDYNNYDNPPHLDNDKIKLHLQIYLGDEKNIGTSLYSSDLRESIFHTFNYNCNSGYALLHNEHSWHGLDSVIKNDRKSIYARYY